MTYCVGVLTHEGLVLAGDSRTNAGLDFISTFRKLACFEVPGERFIGLLSAGNLATSQAVVTMIGDRLEDGTEETSLLKARTMFEAAEIVGSTLRDIIEKHGPSVRAENSDPSASFILGGQISGRPVRLFQIYAAGNFLEATPDTPYLQIGETKYGKPILDRVIDYEMSLPRAAKAALLSFDSTMRSNLLVGLPLDLLVYRADAFRAEHRMDISEDDPYYSALRQSYGEGLVQVFDQLPEPPLNAPR